MGWNIFSNEGIVDYTELVKTATTNPVKDADLMALSNKFREKFKNLVIEKEEQKEVVNFLNRFVGNFYFISLFFLLPPHIVRFALFAEVIADKLVKKGSLSFLKAHLKNLLVEKSTVRYRGIISAPENINEPTPGGSSRGGSRTPPPRTTIREVMNDLRTTFQITDEEAILINEVIDELMKTDEIANRIIAHIHDNLFLYTYREKLKQRIIDYYIAHNWKERLIEGPYVSPGGIIEYIVQSVIKMCETQAS